MYLSPANTALSALVNQSEVRVYYNKLYASSISDILETNALVYIAFEFTLFIFEKRISN